MIYGASCCYFENQIWFVLKLRFSGQAIYLEGIMNAWLHCVSVAVPIAFRSIALEIISYQQLAVERFYLSQPHFTSEQLSTCFAEKLLIQCDKNVSWS